MEKVNVHKCISILASFLGRHINPHHHICPFSATHIAASCAYCHPLSRTHARPPLFPLFSQLQHRRFLALSPDSLGWKICVLNLYRLPSAPLRNQNPHIPADVTEERSCRGFPGDCGGLIETSVVENNITEGLYASSKTYQMVDFKRGKRRGTGMFSYLWFLDTDVFFGTGNGFLRLSLSLQSHVAVQNQIINILINASFGSSCISFLF